MTYEELRCLLTEGVLDLDKHHPYTNIQDFLTDFEKLKVTNPQQYSRLRKRIMSIDTKESSVLHGTWSLTVYMNDCFDILYGGDTGGTSYPEGDTGTYMSPSNPKTRMRAISDIHALQSAIGDMGDTEVKVS